MAGHYELNWNAAGNRLIFALHGMWDAPTMARWDKDFRAAVAKAPATAWTVLGDLTDHPAQTPEIQNGHEKLMALSAEKGMVMTALVVPKAVVAMQMKRLAGQSRVDKAMAFVPSVAEAERVLGG